MSIIPQISELPQHSICLPGAELGHVPILEKRLRDIHPSPENDQLYRPINPRDPDIVALAKSIKERGVLEPLVVTLDGFILSGHRRDAAAKLARLKVVPCRVEPINRAMKLPLSSVFYASITCSVKSRVMRSYVRKSCARFYRTKPIRR